MDNVPRLISRLRGQYSVDRVARMVGCRRETLWRWEAGRTSPSPLAIEKLRVVAARVADATNTPTGAEGDEVR